MIKDNMSYVVEATALGSLVFVAKATVKAWENEREERWGPPDFSRRGPAVSDDAAPVTAQLAGAASCLCHFVGCACPKSDRVTNAINDPAHTAGARGEAALRRG